MTNPTNTDLAAALREIADTLPLGSALIVRLAADRLGEDRDGWIVHDGKGRPNLPDGTKTETRHRNGDEYTGRAAWTVDQWHNGPGFWADDGSKTVITHYRIVK